MCTQNKIKIKKHSLDCQKPRDSSPLFLHFFYSIHEHSGRPSEELTHQRDSTRNIDALTVQSVRQTDRQTCGQKNIQTDRQTDMWTEEQKDRQTCGQKNRKTDPQTCGQKNRQTDRQTRHPGTGHGNTRCDLTTAALCCVVLGTMFTADYHSDSRWQLLKKLLAFISTSDLSALKTSLNLSLDL